VRIAVDAKLLANPGTGIGRYTRELLSHMTAMGHEWLLYGERPFFSELTGSERVLARFGSAEEGSLKGLWWSQFVYRRWARRDAADLFWSPRHHLPLLLPAGLPRVVTVHDMVWRQFPQTMPRRRLWLERALMGPSLRSADRIICVSRFTASELFRYYPSAMGRCRVIHCGVERHAVVSRPSIELPERFMLFVGTPEPRKNLPRLLRALSGLKEDPVVPPLLVVGSGGWGQEDLPGLVASLGLEDRVLLAGYLGDAELEWVYSKASALLMPSLYEGFGLPALEAMGHGVPVVAASTAALPEVVGGAGLMVNPFSEADIAEAVRRLMHDAALRADLSKRSLERARAFSWRRAAEETLAVFEAVLAEHEPRAWRGRGGEVDSG
jgi:glycosyltransferase involved in cell wall biosynthesis